MSLSWAQNQCSKKERSFRGMRCLALLLEGHASTAAGIRMDKLVSWHVGQAALTLPVADRLCLADCGTAPWVTEGFEQLLAQGAHRVKCRLHCSKIWVYPLMHIKPRFCCEGVWSWQERWWVTFGNIRRSEDGNG